VLKAGVSALRTSDLPSTTVRDDFIAALRPYAILSKLDKAPQVTPRMRLLAFGTGTVAYRVGERKNIPISRPGLLGVTVEPLAKVAALTVATKETLATPGASIDVALARDLVAAVGQKEDMVFLDPAEADSVLSGAPNAASAGTTLANIDADMQKAIELLLAAGGKLRDAVWVLTPVAATKLAGMRGTDGALAFPDIGPNGGTLLKLPAIVSEAADGFLSLIDQSRVLVEKDVGAEVSLSENAMLQMTDDPTDLPDAPVTMVSIFQTECVAFKAVLYRSWKVLSGAGAYITGGIW